MAKQKLTKEERSAKHLRYMMWGLNIFGATITFASFTVLILSLEFHWGEGEASIFTGITLAGIAIMRKEATRILNVFIDKFRKEHKLKPRIPTEDEIEDESHEGGE